MHKNQGGHTEPFREKSKTVVVIGPTGSGKSEAAKYIAEINNCIVIGADTCQMYAELPILSMAFTDYKSSLFICDCHKGHKPDVFAWFKSIKRHLPAVIVGGSNMYIYSLLNGLHDIPELDVQDAQDFVNKFGIDKALKKISSVCTLQHYTDYYRVQRYLSFVLNHNRCMHDYIIDDNKMHIDTDFLVINIIPNYALYDDIIKQRIEHMFNHGVIDEVLIASKIAHDDFAHVIGFREIYSMQKGDISLDACKEKIFIRTRRFAKGQIRWINNKIIPLCQSNNIQYINVQQSSLHQSLSQVFL